MCKSKRTSSGIFSRMQPPKYLHVFATLPNNLQLQIGGSTVITTAPNAPVDVKQGTALVVSDSIDVPFSAARNLVGPDVRLSWTGQYELESVIKGWGHVCNGVTINTGVVSSAPAIMDDLAFLAALEVSIDQYGTSMPSELQSSLRTFIGQEKQRHNISSDS